MWRSIVKTLKQEKEILFVAGVAFFSLMFSSDAFSQCGPAKSVDEFLKNSHGEVQKWAGFPDKNSKQDRIMFLYENPKTKAWSLIIYTLDNNTYCFLAGGDKSTDMLIKPRAKGTAS
tara:strand:+ start:132 stop:482 length:351 start_codon:yes stop_codon:yes gene_type:complete